MCGNDYPSARSARRNSFPVGRMNRSLRVWMKGVRSMGKSWAGWTASPGYEPLAGPVHPE